MHRFYAAGLAEHSSIIEKAIDTAKPLYGKFNQILDLILNRHIRLAKRAIGSEAVA
ncbi:hypothetical protein GCM10007857_71170 [Bradyrhizobium iriomotense]|uniref:GntR C-terminal domain-containing protein n=1 Tax=Bradyrhizobium iriomotense TaxID=441950 RepID=A0ABQ6B7P6_9BRAD|nr:hypothetical protein GCM10007857_71170 [Bradyrhizobium iriomotense]